MKTFKNPIRRMKQGALLAVILASTVGMTSCTSTRAANSNQALAAIQLYDRNGVQETISNKERTQAFEKKDFLAAQPYQKVIRTYPKRRDGSSFSKITTYHDNGQIWQYLETVNGRACGDYIEWYENGAKRMMTKVIEGVGDIHIQAQASWVFDGKSLVWDDEGNLMAEIQYAKGFLDDRSLYYHPNGAISKIIPYKRNLIDGVVKVFNPKGDVIGRSEYVMGKKDGISDFKGNEFIPKREEFFKEGKLISGKYWDFQGKLISEIEEGNGIKPTFENGVLLEEREYKNGIAEGQVKLYRENGTLETSFHMIDGKKDGEEWCYYDTAISGQTLQPMLHLNWKDDEIHGTVRSWYDNGTLESEKEISSNKKNGVLLAWYKNGSLMMVEEYENDRLVNGKYLQRDDESPVSRVINGSGVATIYDADGKFVRKVEYEDGTPKGSN